MSVTLKAATPDNNNGRWVCLVDVCNSTTVVFDYKEVQVNSVIHNFVIIL